MKLWITTIIITVTFTIIGCQVNINEPDITPPSSPRGIATATGDNEVELSWYKNPERDVAGYKIYVSNAYDGTYDLIGTTRGDFFLDNGARNGNTYYYAVTAYDYEGNESDLSKDIAYDTPRPEGTNVYLANFRTEPKKAGYDFSTYSIGDYNDKFTDFYFEYYQGNFYINVWEDTDIQDMGYTSSLYEITEAPASGWSPSKDARLIPGHTYIIWTWDDHYAKIRIVSLSSGKLVFDWAYQLQKGNPELKRTVLERKTLTQGSGVKNRM